ncbi:sigma-70 family RNA polymerase sigma factor [Mariniblastus fucicola]|uniref:RNA polymerase sigma factor n=1 Tax=Mariniblastus fucicola TaxID=980251 RepID=A0A5B9P5X9_9BACT|nr:sigma-70 family RNA polymerase sigma factor [Mariniblastus fucicola]QEG21738.1 RNA polymerase sigma factor [Mariniblastus fucicola]
MKDANSSAEFDSAQKELIAEFTKHRETLWKAIFFRLDHRLGGRIDPDDVLQEAWLDANMRLKQFVEERASWTMHIWIRVILRQTLVNVHRRHFSSKKRDASKEIGNTVSDGDDLPTMADCYVGRVSTPSQAAMKKESFIELETALQRMKPKDRTVLTLRHFDELSNKEVAARLGLSEKAASIRYVRAIERLKKVLESPGPATSAN